MSIAIVSLVSLFLCAEPADAVKQEMMKLEGEWSMVSGERAGMALPEDVVKTGKRISKDGETTVIINEMTIMKAKFSVDPSKKPKTIDYVISEGPNKDKKVMGIYELDGDTAKFCFAGPDKDRPTEFSTKEEDGRTLSVWKRAKK